MIYFDAQIVPDLANGSPFKLAFVSFWLVPIILWVFLYFMAQDVPGSSCTFPALVLESAISPRGAGSF